jgi:hypothetical protein
LGAGSAGASVGLWVFCSTGAASFFASLFGLLPATAVFSLAVAYGDGDDEEQEESAEDATEDDGDDRAAGHALLRGSRRLVGRGSLLVRARVLVTHGVPS